MNTSFGETLRTAREAKGLTTSQIAAKTRMLVQIVEEMENEDFHRIAAPIYGRGFVKLYAECVDLDPMPLVKEFMEIYEGRRAPIVRTRDVPVQAPAPQPEPAPKPPPVVLPPAPEPEPEPIPEPPPVVVPLPVPNPPPVAEPTPEPTSEPPPVVALPSVSEPIPNPPPVAEPTPEPIPEPPPIVRGLELFEAATPSQPQATQEPEQHPSAEEPPAPNVADIFSGSPYLSTESSYGGEGPSAADRFRKNLSSVSHGVIQSVRDIPRSVWRITLLAITSLLLLALLVWGCIKLYQATSITPINQPPTTQDTKEIKDSKDVKAAKNTKNLKGTKTTKATKDPNATKDLKSKPPPLPQNLKTTQRPQQPQPKPAKRPPLRSTGQKVPSLYAD